MITLASMGVSDRKQQHKPLQMAVAWVVCVILYAKLSWGYQSFTLYNTITRLETWRHNMVYPQLITLEIPKHQTQNHVVIYSVRCMNIGFLLLYGGSYRGHHRFETWIFSLDCYSNITMHREWHQMNAFSGWCWWYHYIGHVHVGVFVF